MLEMQFGGDVVGGGRERVFLVFKAVNSSLGVLFSLERCASLAKREEAAGGFQDAVCVARVVS